MPKTREEVVADFYEKTGAQPLTDKERNTIKPLNDAIENLLLVENSWPPLFHAHPKQ